MDIEWVRAHCLSLPHTTETIQWGNDLVFKVGGKMYAVAAVEPGQHWLSFKCSPDDFAELIERPGVVPAPYMARAQWVALQESCGLTRPEVKQRLKAAYDLIFAKLAKKTQRELAVTS